jgi:hypothetical protein
MSLAFGTNFGSRFGRVILVKGKPLLLKGAIRPFIYVLRSERRLLGHLMSLSGRPAGTQTARLPASIFPLQSASVDVVRVDPATGPRCPILRLCQWGFDIRSRHGRMFRVRPASLAAYAIGPLNKSSQRPGSVTPFRRSPWGSRASMATISPATIRGMATRRLFHLDPAPGKAVRRAGKFIDSM